MFSNMFEVFWYNKSHKFGLQGFKNPETMEMLGLGPSDNKIEILLTKMKQNNSPELLNPLFKYIFHNNDPKKC